VRGVTPHSLQGGGLGVRGHGSLRMIGVSSNFPRLNLAGKALTPGAQRSWWLREALAAEQDAAPRPPLKGDINADVVVVGGGFTGLWTAYFLTQAKPDLNVVVLEQDICGGGPSGRNGGFASGWWDELDGLVTLYGPAEAVRACRAISGSINGIGEFCRTNGVDAWYHHAGYLYAATALQHEAVCEEMVKLAREVGAPDELRRLSPQEVKVRCASPAFHGGVFMKDGASVQPALLARGLRRVALERGVTIYEGTPVTRLDSGPPAVAITPGGSVRAPRAVLALNAWAVGWPQLRRRLVAWSSYIVLTAPAPEKLAEIGWTGGELVTDLRTSVRYFRTTRDGRIAFGGGGGRASSRIDDSFTRDMRAVEEAADGFRRLFPNFAEVPLEDAWGGPIDVSPTHLPNFGSLEPGNLFYALGYTGNGVAPSHLAGKVIADLLTGADTDSTRLPMVNRKPRLFPPEPLRSIGAAVVRRAIIAKDTAEERGHRPNPLMSAIARMPRHMGYLLGP
jgi:glycine/D-amino acid oxidase-like deaminating enzyme